MKTALAFGLVCALLVPAPAKADQATVVAVFAIEDTRPPKSRLSAREIENLTDFLATRISESGTYKIIPNAQIRTALRDKKKESFQACFDTACQIEIGKEVAAQKTLATKIVPAGKQCILISTLFDLRESTSERSADHEGGCDAAALFATLKSLSAKLLETKGGKGRTEAEPPKTKVFDAPREQNHHLDVCLHWGVDCGEPAAGAWCRKQGFAGASDFEEGTGGSTFVIGDNRVCEPDCGFFTRVECADQARLDALERRTFVRPMIGPNRLDVCLHWGKECGAPAASAWCKQNGFERAVQWTNEAAGQDPTLVIGDNKVCQPNCGAVRNLTCERPRVHAAATKWFDAPHEQGHPPDICMRSGYVDCGEAPADAWCKKQGWAGAIEFETGAGGPTLWMGENNVCKPDCAFISRVQCADQAHIDGFVRETFERPMLGPNRLDWCLRWGADCGLPAATAWCKQRGFERAVRWSEESAGQQPTQIISDGKVCQPNCGGLYNVVCERHR